MNTNIDKLAEYTLMPFRAGLYALFLFTIALFAPRELLVYGRWAVFTRFLIGGFEKLP